jgi:hypothetical protein
MVGFVDDFIKVVHQAFHGASRLAEDASADRDRSDLCSWYIDGTFHHIPLSMKLPFAAG